MTFLSVQKSVHIKSDVMIFFLHFKTKFPVRSERESRKKPEPLWLDY